MVALGTPLTKGHKMNEDVRYIDVPVASGPHSTTNTCGGCGGSLVGNSHHVFDCLITLNNRLKNLETHPATVGVGNCAHHNHVHGQNCGCACDHTNVGGTGICQICGLGPPL